MIDESKFKKFFRKSVLTVLALGAIAGGTVAAAEIKNSSLPSNEDMMFLAESIDADMSFSIQDWQGNYRVLPHNNGKPIYISISDEILNSDYSQVVKDNIDYIFNVVGRINPQYKYEIVSENDIFTHKLLMQSVIQIKNENLSKIVENDGVVADAIIRENSNILDLVSTSNERSNITISIDLNNIKNKNNVENYLASIFRDEFDQACGLNDTYSASTTLFGKKNLDNLRREYYSTLMETGNFRENFLNNYTPHDFKRFVSVLHENGTAKDVEHYKQLCEDYTKEYYEELEKFILERKDIPYPENAKECVRLTNRATFYGESEKGNDYIFDVKINGDKYLYQMYKDGELIGDCEGDVIHCDNMTFLLDVHVPFFTPSDSQGFIGDLVLVKNGGAYSCFSPELDSDYYFDDVEKVKISETEFGY